jgi:hypothetical protein
MGCAALILLLPMLPGAAPADTLVVCPSEFREALGPWLEHRRRQGRQIELLPNEGTAEQVRGRIRAAAVPGTLRFIVLVGDADPGGDAAARTRCVPARLEKAKVNIRWGSEPEIATDNWYADLDDDRLPDAAIGRLTADSAEELRTIVRKILAYERAADHGPWRRRVNLVAGVGGFGMMADATIEAAAKMLLTDGIPAGYETTFTYGSWQSPYCPDPRKFREATIDRLNEGSVFWVYMGHGQRWELDRVRAGMKQYPVLTLADVRRLRCASGSPIAVLFACYTGAYDEPRDCLAEELLRREGGPVAILCGSRVTMPYAMSVFGCELLGECFARRRETIGEAVLAAKRASIQPAAPTAQRKLIEAVAALVSPRGINLSEERYEHLHLFNLIGDPLLRIPHPGAVTLNAPVSVAAGEEVDVTGTCEVEGSCTVELVVRRDRLTFEPPRRRRFEDTDAALAAYEEVYRRANDARLASVEVAAAAGRFRARLAVPEGVSGPCHVRAFVQGKSAVALGAADLFVKRRPAATAPGSAPTP